MTNLGCPSYTMVVQGDVLWNWLWYLPSCHTLHWYGKKQLKKINFFVLYRRSWTTFLFLLYSDASAILEHYKRIRRLSVDWDPSRLLYTTKLWRYYRNIVALGGYIFLLESVIQTCKVKYLYTCIWPDEPVWRCFRNTKIVIVPSIGIWRFNNQSTDHVINLSWEYIAPLLVHNNSDNCCTVHLEWTPDSVHV